MANESEATFPFNGNNKLNFKSNRINRLGMKA